MESIRENKKALRKRISDIAKSSEKDALLEYSRQASKRIIEECDEYKSANVVYAFMSFGYEIDTSMIIEDVLASDKRLLLPRVTDRGMVFKEVTDIENLQISNYGILEPVDELPDVELDGFMLVPGVVMGEDLYRVCHGAGYYDRFFANANHNIYKAGFCYDFQIVNEVPRDEYDVRLDAVYSDKRIIK